MDNITWLVCGRSVWPFRHSSERRSEEFCWLQQDPLLSFFTCAGIALYPGNAQLLGCSHYYHNDIPPLVDPGKPQDIDCLVTEVTYVGPFSSKEEVSLFLKKKKEKTQLIGGLSVKFSTDWQKRALVIQGPSEVRSKEVVFMQFSSNETGEDFSAIGYMIFADFGDLMGR